MTNKESKLKEKILIISIALILILMGLIIYIRYTNKEESKVVEEVNNYYTAEFLFNNDYIKIASTIEDFNKDTNNLYMYLDGNNILHIKYKNKESEINKTVEGLPKGEVTVYYSTLGNDCFEFGGLLENNFYYSNFCLNENEQPFEMISTNARTVYTPSIDKKEVHVINNAKITSNFIIDTETEEMKYLSYKDNVLGLYNNIEKIKPYFNYICASNNTKLCNDIMLYLTFDNELVLNYAQDDIIKNDIGDDLIVEEFFGVLKIPENSKTTLENITFKNLKKLDYLFTVYVLDKNNNLYTIDINNNLLKEKAQAIAINASSKKVKKLDYEKDNLGNITSIVITYEDGTTDKITKKDNLDIISSTVYDRDNIN